MRSSLVAVLLGLSLVGCDVGDPIDGGGGGGGGGPDAAELVPRVDVVVDKPTVMTELKTTTQITVSLAATGGFSGQVALTATVVDANNAPMTGWTVALNQPTVNLTDGGSGTAVATLTIPSENKGLVGKVKIDAVSSAGAATVSSDVTALNQVSIPITLNAMGQCVYPPSGTINVTIGSKLRFVNKAATADNITIHVDNGGGNGVPHQADPGSPQNMAYERTLTGTPAGLIGWYCHAPGPTVNNLKIQPVAAQ